LKSFIEDYGFQAVLSEYGDIFYDYKKHIQDACLEEINKCQLFILIVGNNYGSVYHNNPVDSEPDSVTLQEFKKSIESDLSKHIFVNRDVDHDYRNYKKLLNKHIEKSLEHDVQYTDEDIDRIRTIFGKTYMFPEDSYRYIFRFLDILNEPKTNNGIETFDSFNDIREHLRKQWSGLVYDYLMKNKIVGLNELAIVNGKLTSIDIKLNKLVKSMSSDKPSKTSIKRLANEINLEEIEQIKKQIFDSLNSLLYNDNDDEFSEHRRVIFREKWDEEKTKKWIDTLNSIVLKYRWSKYVSVQKIFNNINYVFYRINQDVDYNSVFLFNKAYNDVRENSSEDDFSVFISTITDELNKQYEIDESKKTNEDKLSEVTSDDVPF
jgi:hypothetical protein